MSENLEKELSMEEKMRQEIELDYEKKQLKKQIKKEIKKEKKQSKKKNGKQVAFKVLSTTFYVLITIVAAYFEIWAISDSVEILTMSEPGMAGFAFIILLPILLIVPVASLILYSIPYALSLVGFIKAFKKSSKKTRITGKVWFGILIALIIVSEAILIIGSVATILAVKFCQ